MGGHMVWVIWAALAAIALFLAYCCLVAPNLRHRKIDLGRFIAWDYAHRGLHDIKRGVPENSLPAFSRACEAGYGIEMDIRATRDGHLVVHHDADLKRSCGDIRRVCDTPLKELQALPLFGTQEHVPTLDEALACVNGRAPLIVELKTDQSDASLAPEAYRRLSLYGGIYCVESFDPVAMSWFKHNAPDVVRGQLASMPPLKGMPLKERFRRLMLGYLLVNAISRPDFIAYDYTADANASFRFVAHVFRPMLVGWTVRDADTSKKLRAHYDIQIFESFRAKREAL